MKQQKAISKMETTQTAVEWLDRWFRDNPEATHEEGNKALQRAKQMEKKQIIAAHNDGKNVLPPNENGDQYYIEKYGNKEML